MFLRGINLFAAKLCGFTQPSPSALALALARQPYVAGVA